MGRYTIRWRVPTAGKGTACQNIAADDDYAAYATALRMCDRLRGHGDYIFELRGPDGSVVGTG